MADLAIRNGHIFDPAEGLDFVGDIIIENGIIQEMGEHLPQKAALEMDASGYYVSPGWIDIHGHLYEGGTPNGMPVDLGAIPMGVTAIADAGSSGVANYQNLLHYLRNSKIKAKLMLNVSACGIIMPAQFPEPLDPSVWDMKLFKKAFRECGDDVMALKVRVSKNVVGDLGLAPLKRAVEVAEELGTKVVVHTTDPAGTMAEITGILRKGDVLCHMYQGNGDTILNADRKVSDEMFEARARGVIFDAASGRGNYAFSVARKAIEQGFLPDSISTDTTLQSWNHPLAGQLPVVMTKYLPLGMDLGDIIKCVTSGPAVQFGCNGLGTLRVGTPADITVFDMPNRKMVFKDKFNEQIVSDKVFVPKATVIDGNIQYRSADCPLV